MLLPMALALVPAGASAAFGLHIEVEPRFGDRLLLPDESNLRTGSNRELSVTRLDLLLSGLELRRAGSGWMVPDGWSQYVSLRALRTNTGVVELPPGRYDRLRFLVGVLPEVNHADPTRYGPNDPLNPNVNGLYWDWQAGYVFLALEGGWKARGGKALGYSFHLGSDRQLMSVDLPVALDLTSDKSLRLDLDVQRILDAPNRIEITEASCSTHSRPGDPLADQLRENVQQAFSVGLVGPWSGAAVASGAPTRIDPPPGTHPYVFEVPGGFPRPALPEDNPLTVEGVQLGRKLFQDARFSINGRQSCASCHRPSAAYVDPGKAVSPGAEGNQGTRNTMSLFNLAWKQLFFWDGRAPSLREQVLQPIQNPMEMHETLSNVVAKLAAGDSVRGRFAEAFGTPEVTIDRIARALEQFLLTRVSADSKFDRFLAGEATLSPEEERGRRLFFTEYDPARGLTGADCFHCHKSFLFKSQDFANNGLDGQPTDLGRFVVTGRRGDRGRFAVPSLRNVALTAPYMHDGRIATLEQAVEHYRSGVKRSPTLDPNLAKHPDGGVPFSESDRGALVAFLSTLTDMRLLENQDFSRYASPASDPEPGGAKAAAASIEHSQAGRSGGE